MQIKKILWASDGSKESLDALGWAEMFASRSGAKLIALHVVESSPSSRFKASDGLKEDMSLVNRELITKETARLRRVGTVLEQKGIEVETRVAEGVPYQEIIKAAQSHRADLIAMGKRGLNLWNRVLLGSTTSRVLREVRVPVLTVRASTKKPVVKRIVIPSSFTPADNVALERAIEWARTLGASIDLLHITEAHKSWDAAKGGFMGRRRKLGTEKLNSMLRAIPIQKRKGVPVFTTVKAFPRPWSGIINFVRDQGIDVIVLSTHARKGVPRFFLGSVAERVITEAPCPVITVRP